MKNSKICSVEKNHHILLKKRLGKVAYVEVG